MNTGSFHEIENLFIPLQDGRQLSARIWMPDRAKIDPVPAILEYLPYRKRDGTAQRDDSTYPVFASAGYAGVRVDISGTGESDGDFDDEYSPRELRDGIEVIQWIAARSWCNGAVGMMGISWGGFNSLQIAALNPPALKAVISIGSTVDRYNDDIHYKQGCLLYSNFWWSAVMLCYASRPPDPQLVGAKWRDMWFHRLETQPFPLETWLSHQRRDAYWQHGSICENYKDITVPALVISGWADGYINAPPAAVANLESCSKAINGPWIHKYPHFAYPHPRMDFHAEAISWWDHWLKNLDNGIDDLPDYRAYISENVRPMGRREHESGRWIAESSWPSQDIVPETLNLHPDGQLSASKADAARLSVCSPQDCGTACGEIFTLKPDAEMQSDQRSDDAGSLVFETAVLKDAVEILGRPSVALRVAIDKPVGNLAIRLVDVHPDGVGFRVSWGVLNLGHHHGNDDPQAMKPGKAVDIGISLDECGYRFLPGHRIRLSISTAYWPMIMPPPEAVTAIVTLGNFSSVTLPTRTGGDEYPVPAPGNQNPLPDYTMHKPAHCERKVERDLQNQETHYCVVNDTGEEEVPDHGMLIRERHEDHWKIDWYNPLGATASSRFTYWMSRNDWAVRTETTSSWRCDATHYHIEAEIRAYENEKPVNQRNWKKSIKRDLM